MKITGCSLVFHISAFDLDFNLRLRNTIPNETSSYVPLMLTLSGYRGERNT